MPKRKSKEEKVEFNNLQEWAKIIDKIGQKEHNHLSVRRLIKYLNKCPPKAIVELRIFQRTNYGHDPIAFWVKMKKIGIGEYNRSKFVITLIADRES
jgi:hypothetical protein